MSLLQSIRVEHLFETGDGSVVQVMTAIPHAFERGNLVVTGAFTCLESEPGIRPERYSENVQRSRHIRWRVKALRERQLVAGVQRRCVTPGASLPREDLLSRDGSFVDCVR